MKLFIDRDFFDNPKPPRLFLCTTGKKIINELPAYELSGDFKWGTYSEMEFSIDRQYVDVLTGELKVHPTFDKAEGLRKVYMENMGYFVIQDPNAVYGDKDSKTLSCFSSEYETANKYLENFRINTGDIDSKEVIALESIYGYNYTIDADNLYKKASEFDEYEAYYVKNHTDNDSYVYEQVEIKDVSDYNTYDGSTVAKTLYVKSYPNIRFYWPTNTQFSLLHIVFEKIPGWTIKDVDVSLRRKERKFDEDRISVYDFLMNEVQDTFNCVVEWDTENNEVYFYEEAEDGITDDNTIQTRWDTDVFISRDNLASEININYSTDDIKTKLKVSGADDLDIREVNLGKNYIMNLDYYHTLDWMEPDLFEAYGNYLEAVKKYSPQYTELTQKWVGAYNQWNDMMNAVPAEGNVVLVGDPFEKLYCIKTPVATAYTPHIILDTTSTIDVLYSDKQYLNEIDKSTLSDGDIFVVEGYEFIYNLTNNNFEYSRDLMVDNLYGENGLIEKLTLYHVNEDLDASNSDNYLLRLKNKNSDIATLRIYNANKNGTDAERKANPVYKIQVVIIYAQSGIKYTSTDESLCTMEEWIRGELTANHKKINLKDYTIQSIGTMGAYFVLTKDETQEATLKEYGVNLLKEKHKTYTTIFQAQTEAMFSQEKYQCIAQSTQPDGDFDVGTRWLKTNSSPVELYQYVEKRDNNGEIIKVWDIFDGNVDNNTAINYENYQRYIDNYEKLQAVQKVLLSKERQATYMRDGYAIMDRSIDTSLYTKGNDGALRYEGETLEGDMHRAAESHFPGCTVTRSSMDQDLFIYTFTTSYYPFRMFAVYLKGTTPYVAYLDSQGVYQAQKDWITSKTNFESFFNEDQWIRLSPLIREDEFSDSNFLLTGYESEEERLEIGKELLETSNKELNKLCQPKLEFSMEMANILALPEFHSIVDQFQLGNFVRVYIRDGYTKRARLLSAHVGFNDLSDFSCEFGNLVTTQSEIDKHAELLSQAVTAGKQVATSAGDWQKAVDKSNKLEQDIASGLQNAALEVGRASGQSIVWDEHGIWGRKLIDGTTDQYHPEQFRIINNKLVFSNDGFKTSKAMIGSYTVNGETRWGPLAEYVTADTIEGKLISGGRIEIGEDGKNKFIVDENGNVSILVGGEEKYAGKEALDEINKAYQYTVELLYSGSTVFASTDGPGTIVTAVVKNLGEDITHTLPIGTQFVWLRNGTEYKTTVMTNENKPQNGVVNTDAKTLTANQINITHADIEGNSFFSCQVNFDETLIQKGE
jgi:hypothetical protein